MFLEEIPARNSNASVSRLDLRKGWVRSFVKSEKITAAVALAVSAFIIVESRKYPLGTVDNPGPGFLPLLTGIVLGVMSLILLTKSFMEVSSRGQGAGWPNREGAVKIAFVFIVLVLFTVFFEITGYFINIFVLFFVLLRPVGKQRWPVTISVSMGAVLASYLLFDLWLKIPLPRGIWLQSLS